eukprot:317884_1
MEFDMIREMSELIKTTNIKFQLLAYGYIRYHALLVNKLNIPASIIDYILIYAFIDQIEQFNDNFVINQKEQMIYKITLQTMKLVNVFEKMNVKQNSPMRDWMYDMLKQNIYNRSFKDIYGLINVKLAMFETVILPQQRPELFSGAFTAQSTAFLLFGPPGNAHKTIVKCLAKELNLTFISISGLSIVGKHITEAEKLLRISFGHAREKAPSIIFIDHIDKLFEFSDDNEDYRRIRCEFLIQADGIHASNSQVILIATTHSPDRLNEAVLRRFPKRILVSVPEYETRYALIRNFMRKKVHVMNDAEFIKVAKATEGYSRCDVVKLCKDAVLESLQDDKKLLKTNISHFENSLKNVVSSVSKESLLFYEKWNVKYGSKFFYTTANANLPQHLKPNSIEPLD